MTLLCILRKGYLHFNTDGSFSAEVVKTKYGHCFACVAGFEGEGRVERQGVIGKFVLQETGPP